jgi:hypothetical protein
MPLVSNMWFVPQPGFAIADIKDVSLRFMQAFNREDLYVA